LDSRLPHALECVLTSPSKLFDRNIPQRIRPCVAKRAVVGKDLEVVVAFPPGAVERADDLRKVDDAVAG
jgi:hypothetical protein